MRRRSMMIALVLACATAPALASCGGSGGSSSAGGNAVSIKSFAYSPAEVSVSKGTTVSFTNGDSTEHTATADGGQFDTGAIAEGQTKTVTLAKPGTFTYVCSFHPFMHGTVTVR